MRKPRPPELSRWFSVEELARSARYHRTLFRLQAFSWAGLMAVLAVMVLSGAPWTATAGTGPALFAGALLAVIIAPFEAAIELWRAVAGRRTVGPSTSVVVVAVLSEVAVRSLGRAAVLPVVPIGIRWWVSSAGWVSRGAVPALLVLLAWIVQERAGWWRTRRQGLTPVPPGPALEVLWSLTERLCRWAGPDGVAERGPLRPLCSGRSLPVAWWVNSDAAARRSTAGSTWLWRGRQHVALDPAVLRGGRALLEVVAAHELAHFAAGARGSRPTRPGTAGDGSGAPTATSEPPWSRWPRAMVPVGAQVLVLAGLGWLLGWALGDGPLSVTQVLRIALGAGAMVVPISIITATRARRHELLVDRWSLALLSDPAASARVARDLLVEADVDLHQEGLRRWFADHPPPARRLALLAGGPAEDAGCVAIA